MRSSRQRAKEKANSAYSRIIKKIVSGGNAPEPCGKQKRGREARTKMKFNGEGWRIFSVEISWNGTA